MLSPAQRGLKRVCAGCGSRYYDFNKRPILCPSCGVEFSADVKVKARRGRIPAGEAVLEDDLAVTAVESDAAVEGLEDTDLVSLEDVEAMEDADDIDSDDDAIDLDADLDDLDEDLDEELEVEVDEEN